MAWSRTSPFNEAGAIEPRKPSTPWSKATSTWPFNEAGAIEPRKPSLSCAALAPSPTSFNEAGAIEPRKRPGPSSKKRHKGPSMRPGQ